MSGDVIFVRVRITNFTVLRALPNTKPEYVYVYIYDILATFFYTKKNISLNIYFVFCKNFFINFRSNYQKNISK